MAHHDESYKQLFSHAEMVADLLRGFVHEPWVAQLDFSTLEKVNASYVSDDLRVRHDDVVWRVRWGSKWLYVYVIIEFQSDVDPFMAVRLLTYVGLLYQDLIKSGAVAGTDKLPPVFPLVLYNGRRRWDARLELAELIEIVPGGLADYRPSLRYAVIDEGAYALEELEPLRNLAAALFRLENSKEPKDVVAVIEALVGWLKDPGQRTLRRALTVWLARVILPKRWPDERFDGLSDLGEMRAMLAERVQEWTRTWREEGRQEGEARLLLRLLERRFGPLPPWVEQRVTAARSEQVEGWTDRLLDARSLDEVFEPAE